MRQKTSQILFSYWNEVRGTRLAPRRFDIEPSRISSILPETFILEEADGFRFRLAGTRICEQFGVELRGEDFLFLWEDDDRALVAAHLAEISARGGVGVLTLEARGVGHAPAGASPAAFEIVLLPLMHTQNRIDRFLGALSVLDAPLWLGTMALAPAILLSREVIWPEGRPHVIAERMQSERPVLQPEFEGARVVRIARRQFRVLDGGLAKEPGGEP
jgi:hypothetical protein